MEQHIGGIAEDFLSQEERARLVGLCGKLTGNFEVAEDLAQETLLLAWRGIEGLREPEKRSAWIAGIARNVSLRWLRQQGRDSAHRLLLSSEMQEQSATPLEELVADEFDLEVELERKELINLLDRALALLPVETRAVLVRRYVDESPLAEIATQLGTNASAVAMRLQRGKLALRKVLSSEMREEAMVYEQAANERRWDSTSLWCTLCGQHRLLGRKQPERGMLYFKCPQCSPGDEVISKSETVTAIRGIWSYKPAYTRLSEWSHNYYRTALRNGEMLCKTCKRMVPAQISPAEDIRQLLWLNQDRPRWAWRPGERMVNVVCSHCNSIDCTTLEGLVLALPEGRAFQRSHSRMHFLPYRYIEFAGRHAIVTRFESVLETASFEVISDYETYEVLRIVGGEQ
jgi:RNA polymerase sigma-70 factor (ECF subfamily)